jgi:hypothetical protein
VSVSRLSDIFDIIYKHQKEHCRPPDRIEITNEEMFNLLDDLARPGQEIGYASDCNDERERPAGVVCWIMGVPICRGGT